MSGKLASRSIGPSRSARLSLDRVRTALADVAWLVCLAAAVLLALGALLVALGANRDNDLVRFVLDRAATVDLGVFSRTNGIKQFTGPHAQTEDALFNWGLGAVAWLVLGRVVDRVVRP